MTRETKVGLMVAGSFVGLVGIVLASKLREGTDPAAPAPPAEQAQSSSAAVAKSRPAAPVAEAASPRKPATLASIRAVPEPSPVDAGQFPDFNRSATDSSNPPVRVVGRRPKEDKSVPAKKNDASLDKMPSASKADNDPMHADSPSDGSLPVGPIGVQEHGGLVAAKDFSGPGDDPGKPLPKGDKVSPPPKGPKNEQDAAAPVLSPNTEDGKPDPGLVGGNNPGLLGAKALPIDTPPPASADHRAKDNDSAATTPNPGVPEASDAPPPAPIKVHEDAAKEHAVGQPTSPRTDDGIPADKSAAPGGNAFPASEPAKKGVPAVDSSSTGGPSVKTIAVGAAPSGASEGARTRDTMGAQPAAPKGDAPDPKIPVLGTQPLVATQPVLVPVPSESRPTGAGVAPRVTSFEYETVDTQTTDTFAAFSKRYYGSEKYAAALQQFNREHPFATDEIKRDPPQLGPGQRVHIPVSADILEKRYAAMIQGLPSAGGESTRGVTLATPVASGQAESKTTRSESRVVPASAWDNPTPSARTYKVQAGGETLYEIARNALGDSTRWREIYHLNPEVDPGFPVPPGKELRLPVAAPTPAKTP
jgi:hypothetical protein